MRLNRRKYLSSDDSLIQALKKNSVNKSGSIVKVGNSLECYPDRRWEEVYRNCNPHIKSELPNEDANNQLS